VESESKTAGRAPAVSPLRLAAGVEVLKGPDNIPLLYVEARDRYIRLSSSGAAIVNMIEAQGNITAYSISAFLAGSCPEKRDEISGNVERFLDQLYQAGALEPTDELRATAAQASNAPLVSDLFRGSRRFVLRFRLWRPNRPLAAKLIKSFRAHAPVTTRILFIGWLLLTAAAISYRFTHAAGLPNFRAVAWPIFLGCIILHSVIHELCHALVSSYYGVKLREFGVGLLYYFIPVAYTDRTDAYRLQDFRSRALIALAGPAWDVSAAGMTTIAALFTSGRLNDTFHVLTLFQLVSCISNLNPLLPGDGYHALEAAFKELNFRRRAFTFFLYNLTGRELPPQLDHLTNRQRTFYLLYALIVAAYVGFLLLLVSYAALKFMQALNNG
jgi:putative peptide zinc metalloprotease protein